MTMGRITGRIKRERAGLVIAFTVLMTSCLTVSAVAHPRHQHAAPETEVTYPALSTEEQQMFEELIRAHTERPDDVNASVALARFAATRARRDGNTDLLKLAGKTLAWWSDTAEPPIDVLVLRANINQIDHRFDDALADLNQVIARDPYNPQARLSRAFVLTTTGKARAAMRDCGQIRPNVSLTIRETCAARALSLTGSARKSLMRLEASLRAFKSNSQAERTFILSVAAEISARIGETQKASALYSELLDAEPRSVFARAAYADFLIVQNKLAAAREIIGDNPHTEALLLLRVLAASGPTDEEARNAAAVLRARMTADLARDDYSHAREYARFALKRMDDPQFAFDMAKANWRVQKEPLDARILLAAAQAAGDHETAHEIAAWIKVTGVEDIFLQAALADKGEPA